MTASQLVPVVPGTIGNVQCLTVDGRALHGVLGVRRDFSTWMKNRIKKYDFVEGQDFEVFFPQTGENSDRGRPSQEYRLAVGMGKELCMVENNEKGRIARRYFIECERRLLAADQAAPDSGLSPALRAELKAIVDAKLSTYPASVQGKARAEIWTRFNRHFTIAEYAQLPAERMPEARDLLIEMRVRALTALPSTPSTDKESLTVAPAIEPAPEQAFAAVTLDAKTYASGKEFFDDVSKLRRNAEGIREALHLFARPCGRSAYLPHEKQVLYDNANEAANVAVSSLNQAIYALRMIYNIRAHVSFSR